jgi:hypothetical protein
MKSKIKREAFQVAYFISFIYIGYISGGGVITNESRGTVWGKGKKRSMDFGFFHPG